MVLLPLNFAPIKIFFMIRFVSTFASLFILCFNVNSYAQFTAFPKNDGWKKIYRATEEKQHDLIHTKLDVKFDFEKSYLYGKAWLTLKPHFYETDSVHLDAKGMDIKQVSLMYNGKLTPLQYNHVDKMKLAIQLNRKYKNTERYTLYIDYTAKPDELMAQGSAAIREAKGLYYINPKGKIKDKPTEVWTQGETEASSVWFPTIDKPNQKTTQEISMTVPSKYVTLSNGLLTLQKKNADGTRTDTWKMDLPHSPYLFFMGVGEFSIVKDSYKGKEVSYYVEKDFEKVARKIFGLTPEMMACFSSKLGVEYPWPKYSQMVGRDYVSGAMENTSATLHSEYLQQNARQLTDGNRYEDFVSHELFHQWFGDLVTAESWGNLTVNESMANFGEVIWYECKYGSDEADRLNYKDMQEYFQSRGEKNNLVRFYYRDKEEMFDKVTYEKGGRILYMLRNIVGEEAFYKSLNHYLTTHKFKNTEAHQLRLSFEEITGKDLNWFFNQWYFNSGHPKLSINYNYNAENKKVSVIVQQKQEGDKLFKMPVAIDIYTGTNKTRHNVWVENKTDTFSFTSFSKPDLINFDGDKYLLAEKEENKTMAEYIFQYKYAKKYVDRREALEYAADNKKQEGALSLLKTALKDPFYNLRQFVLQKLDKEDINDEETKITILSIAGNDPKRLVRADAIRLLGQLKNSDYKELFAKAALDSSYNVSGAALEALSEVDEEKAFSLLPQLKSDAKGALENAIEIVEISRKSDADFDSVTSKYDKKDVFQKAGFYPVYLKYLSNLSNTENFKKGITKIISLRNMMGGFMPQFKVNVNKQLTEMLKTKETLKLTSKNQSLEEQIIYLQKVLKD